MVCGQGQQGGCWLTGMNAIVLLYLNSIHCHYDIILERIETGLSETACLTTAFNRILALIKPSLVAAL